MKNLKLVQQTGEMPVVCIVGYSGSGKTTFIVGLIEEFKQRGFNVGTIKHDVHGFDIDHPGKDSWRHKQAGASTTIISSPSHIGMVMDVSHDHHPLDLLPFFRRMDIVLVEGFKRADLPKLEVYRTENRKPPACKGDKNLLAMISDTKLDWNVPFYALDGYKDIVDMLVQKFDLSPRTQTPHVRVA